MFYFLKNFYQIWAKKLKKPLLKACLVGWLLVKEMQQVFRDTMFEISRNFAESLT